MMLEPVFPMTSLLVSTMSLFDFIFLDHNLELRALVKALFSPENFYGSQN